MTRLVMRPSSAVLKGLHWQKTLGTDLQKAKKEGKRKGWSEREGARVNGFFTSTLLTGETISFPPLLLGADLIEGIWSNNIALDSCLQKSLPGTEEIMSVILHPMRNVIILLCGLELGCEILLNWRQRRMECYFSIGNTILKEWPAFKTKLLPLLKIRKLGQKGNTLPQSMEHSPFLSFFFTFSTSLPRRTSLFSQFPSSLSLLCFLFGSPHQFTFERWPKKTPKYEHGFLLFLWYNKGLNLRPLSNVQLLFVPQPRHTRNSTV